MRALVFASLLTAGACSGGGSATDMGPVFGANGCAPLPPSCAGYCTFAEAPSFWCGAPHLPISVGSCGGYDVVETPGVMGYTLYFYDHATGMLVATNFVPGPPCMGPGDFVFPACDVSTFASVC